MQHLLAKYSDTLREFLSFKSISTDSSYSSEIDKTVTWLQSIFESNSFQVKIIRGYDNPIIIAEYKHDANAETAIIYGHYDVQPANKAEGWTNDPFELLETHTHLYGRGVIDNKGQVLVHMITIFDHIKNGTLQYNVKFLLEGNEETGSPNIARFLNENKEQLAGDFIIVSDGSRIGVSPVIEMGFRGITNCTLELFTSDREMHSGTYGGAVPNAALEMARLLAPLYDEQNRVTIPDYYANAGIVTEEEKANNAKIPFDLAEHFKITGTKKLLTEPEYDFATQTGLRPTAQITGLESGYNGEGYKSGIPNVARAKINFRLVGDQSAEEMFEKLEKYVQAHLPEYAWYKIIKPSGNEGGAGAFKVKGQNKFVEKASVLLAEIYEKEVVYSYVGGTISLLYYLEKSIGIPQLLVPLANEDCNMHALNENFALDSLLPALQFSYKFFAK